MITRMAAHETIVATQVWRNTLAANFPTIDVTVEDALKIAGTIYVYLYRYEYSNNYHDTFILQQIS
jgi:hypothetical protein